MPSWSRRRALQAVATTGAFAIAGCSGESSSSREPPHERGEPVPASDLEVTFARDTDGEPLFAVGDDGNGNGDARDAGTADLGQSFEHLTDAEDRERVTFRSTEPATTLRRFVDGTDLEARSVYLLQRPVRECYEARLVGVYREDDGVDADFCRALRPADVECSADARDTLGVGIRLPFPGDSFSGLGTGWSSDCGPRPTVAAEGGDGA
jgi:hypothetical protein